MKGWIYLLCHTGWNKDAKLEEYTALEIAAGFWAEISYAEL